MLETRWETPSINLFGVFLYYWYTSMTDRVLRYLCSRHICLHPLTSDLILSYSRLSVIPTSIGPCCCSKLNRRLAATDISRRRHLAEEQCTNPVTTRRGTGRRMAVVHQALAVLVLPVGNTVADRPRGTGTQFMGMLSHCNWRVVIV